MLLNMYFINIKYIKYVFSLFLIMFIFDRYKIIYDKNLGVVKNM